MLAPDIKVLLKRGATAALPGPPSTVLPHKGSAFHQRTSCPCGALHHKENEQREQTRWFKSPTQELWVDALVCVTL